MARKTYDLLFKDLVHNVRSDNEDERKLTISQIPSLVLESLEHKNEVLDQLLLVIYNLNTDSESFEVLNLGNMTQVIRHLLRLYTETINEHKHEQIDALTKISDFVHSSELLVELAYALNHCSECKISKEDLDLVVEALCSIKEKAAANLYSDALLMIHSIIAMK